MSRSGLQGSQAGQGRGLGMGPRSRPRWPVLLTGPNTVSKGAGPEFLRITSGESRRVPAGARSWPAPFTVAKSCEGMTAGETLP